MASTVAAEYAETKKNCMMKMSSMEEECMIERRRCATLKEISSILQNEQTSRYNKEVFKKLFQEEVFLGKLFTLFDQNQDEQLNQDEWINFLKGRLTNDKQNEFVDQIESVAYALIGDRPVTPTSFCQIFRTKGVVDKLFRLIDQENTGYVTKQQIMEVLSNVSSMSSPLCIDPKNLAWLETLFKATVGNKREIHREEFKKIMVSKNPFFTERVFQIFDTDNSGSISLQEFLDAINQFAGKTPDDKIRFLFKVYDIDGDGLIQLRELEHVMRACMEENGMKFSDEQITDLTMALFEDSDQGNRGAITFEALKMQLEKHDGLLENLSISIDRWMVPPKPEPKRKSFLAFLLSLRPYQLTKPYIKNNYMYIAFLLLFILINCILFISKLYEYSNRNGFIMFARACGQCLNFDFTISLILMLRQCITFLRTHRFNSIFPLDHHIYLHKVTGICIVMFSFFHALMHLLNYGIMVVNDEQLNSSNYTMTEWLLTTRPKLFGLIPGAANPTGLILLILLIILAVCSMPFVRRGGCFEIFYWTHLLYVPIWFLTIFHAPNFWKWMFIPGAIFLMERIHRLMWLRSQRGKTYISSGLLLPSKVTHLVIKRPPHLDFHPGDYVFVNIPVIAKYEWHPFTISSAPEQEDYMWLHIRAVGEWTSRLYSYFEREQLKLHRGGVIPDGCSNVRKLSYQNVMKKRAALCDKKFSLDSLDDPRGLDNPLFVSDETKTSNSSPTINSPATLTSSTEKKTSRERKLHQLMHINKMPLEKSHSVPDMQIKIKKRARLIALRDYTRSESEKSFDECKIRRARLKSLGLAYLSPQNKSLAQSFRYMRTKPTIIAFKTPSLESCDDDNFLINESTPNTQSTQEVNNSKEIPELAAEEGRIVKSPEKEVRRKTLQDINFEELACQSSITYPVGKPLDIYLDGPYGAPSSHIFQAQHAVLIGAGIGVTPFASILQSIMHRYWKVRHTCPKCSFSWASEIPPTVMNLRKVDFFWINRDQRSFEWFVNLLSQLEIEQAELGATMERFLEMHMYITSALQKNDMKAIGLQLAMDLLHEKEKRDLITGLKTRTNAGRPNWDKVFKQLQERKKGKVTVFYCGPPQLARVLRYKCDQIGFSFRKESF